MLIWEQEDTNTTPPDETLPPGGLTQKLLYWNPVTNKWEPVGIGSGLQVVNGELIATGGGHSAEAQAYFARLTGAYTTQWKDAVNARIVELVTGGVWSLLDVLCAPKIANNDLDSRLNLISSSYTLIGGTFINGSGIRTNGTIVNTGYNPGANALKYTQNNAHYGLFLHSNLTANNGAEPVTRVSGLFSNGVNVSLLYADYLGNAYATINTTGSSTYNTHVPITQGFMQANRLSSSSFTSNFAGTRLTGNHASQPLANVNYLIAPTGWDGVFSAATIGAGLDNTQDELLRTTLETMLA